VPLRSQQGTPDRTQSFMASQHSPRLNRKKLSPRCCGDEGFQIPLPKESDTALTAKNLVHRQPPRAVPECKNIIGISQPAWIEREIAGGQIDRPGEPMDTGELPGGGR
jgi:hypothetical protein